MTRKASMQILMLEWLISAAVLCVIVGAQTLAGKYADITEAKAAWKWVIDGMSTPLALLMTAALSDGNSDWGRGKVSWMRSILAFGISSIYISTYLVSLVLEPFTAQLSQALFEITSMGMSMWQAAVFAAITYMMLEDR